MFNVYEQIRDEVENNQTKIRRVDFLLKKNDEILAMMTCHISFGFTMQSSGVSYFGAICSDAFRWYCDVRPKGQFAYISFLNSIKKGNGYGAILMKMVLKKFKDGVIFNERPYKISNIYGTIPKRDCSEKFYSKRRDLKSFYRSFGFKFKSDNFYLNVTKDCFVAVCSFDSDSVRAEVLFCPFIARDCSVVASFSMCVYSAVVVYFFCSVYGEAE